VDEELDSIGKKKPKTKKGEGRKNARFWLLGEEKGRFVSSQGEPSPREGAYAPIRKKWGEHIEGPTLAPLTEKAARTRKEALTVGAD